MAFVFENIPKEDIPFFKSLGIKNWTGNYPKIVIPGQTTWCVDREKKAFYMYLGGGRAEDPYISTLWWDGLEIRIEFNTDPDIKQPQNELIARWIYKLLIPQKALDMQNTIANMVLEALMTIQKHDEASLGKKFNNEYIINGNTIIKNRYKTEARHD